MNSVEEAAAVAAAEEEEGQAVAPRRKIVSAIAPPPSAKKASPFIRNQKRSTSPVVPLVSVVQKAVPSPSMILDLPSPLPLEKLEGMTTSPSPDLSSALSPKKLDGMATSPSPDLPSTVMIPVKMSVPESPSNCQRSVVRSDSIPCVRNEFKTPPPLPKRPSMPLLKSSPVTALPPTSRTVPSLRLSPAPSAPLKNRASLQKKGPAVPPLSSSLAPMAISRTPLHKKKIPAVPPLTATGKVDRTLRPRFSAVK